MSGINWNLFVDEEPGLLAEPRVIRGVKYATDARICIAAPCDAPDTVSTAKYPNVAKALRPIEKLDGWQPWQIKTPICAACKGTGRLKCSTCNGARRSLCNMGHMHECQDCDIQGTEACYECRSVDCFVKIGRIRITQHYCRVIAGLPGPIEWVTPTEDGPLYFRFAGGCGAAMGLGEKNSN